MSHGFAERCLAEPLPLRDVPFVRDMLDGLFALLGGQGVSPQRFLGAKTPAAWLKNAGSLQDLVDRGQLDGAVLGRALADVGSPRLAPIEAIDRFLAPLLLLAAARPALNDQAPPWLVDALTALIAVDASDAVLDVEMADVRLDDVAGCLTLPWLARRTLPARWLARELGPKQLWRALSDEVAWERLIAPPLLAEALGIHHGVAAPLRPGGHEEDDVLALFDAFHGLTSVRLRVRGLPACKSLVPAGGGLLWRLADGQLQAIRPGALTHSAEHGFLDLPLTALPVPRVLGQPLLGAGWHTLQLRLTDEAAADELLDSLVDLALDPLPPQALEGSGFCLVPWRDP